MTELQFVTAEEAAKWPEGCWVRCERTNRRGFVIYSADERWTAENREHMFRWGYSRFARLPDTLPDLSEEPSDVR